MRYLPCVLCIFTLGCLSNPAPTPDDEDVREANASTSTSASTWIQHCNQARAAFVEREASLIRYMERPAYPKGLAHWSLDWRGVSVLLPAGRYQEVILSRQSDGTPGAILLLDNGDYVILLVHENQQLDELGGQTVGEVVYQAYGWTPDDVACTHETAEQDTLRMKALALKGLPPGAKAVYKGVGSHTGYLFSGTRKNKTFQEAFFTTKTWDAEQLGVYYFVSGANEDLGMLFGKASGDTPSAGTRPIWLDPLQDFFADPTDANLSAFEAAAAKDGLGAKTTASIAQWRAPLP